MTYVITKACIATCDTACVSACPVDCIVGPVPLDELRSVPITDRPQRFPGLQMFIDPDACIDCNSCMDECPVAAIYPEDSLPTEYKGDLARNAEFFRRARSA